MSNSYGFGIFSSSVAVVGADFLTNYGLFHHLDVINTKYFFSSCQGIIIVSHYFFQCFLIVIWTGTAVPRIALRYSMGYKIVIFLVLVTQVPMFL